MSFKPRRRARATRGPMPTNKSHILWSHEFGADLAKHGNELCGGGLRVILVSPKLWNEIKSVTPDGVKPGDYGAVQVRRAGSLKRYWVMFIGNDWSETQLGELSEWRHEVERVKTRRNLDFLEADTKVAQEAGEHAYGPEALDGLVGLPSPSAEELAQIEAAAR